MRVSLFGFWHSNTHSSTRQGEGLRGQLSPWPLPLSACSRSGIMVSFLLRCPSSCQHIWLRYIHVIRGHRESHFVPFPGVKSHTPTFSVLCTLWCFVVNCLRPVMSYHCACPPTLPPLLPLVCVCSSWAVLLPVCSYVPAATLRSCSDTFCNCHKTKQVPQLTSRVPLHTWFVD